MDTASWLSAGLGVVTFLVGLWLSLKERKEGDSDWKWSAFLALLGIAGTCVAVWQGIASARDAEKSGKQITAAKTIAETAEKRAAGAEDKLTKMAEDATKDRKEIERLNALTQPRTLTEQQKIHLHNLLHGRKRGLVEVVSADSLGKEGYLYAKEIKDFLESEGFECKTQVVLEIGEVPSPGVYVAISENARNDKTRVPPHATGLQNALKKSGLGGEGTFASMPDNEVHVRIGTRLELSGDAPVPAGNR